METFKHRNVEGDEVEVTLWGGINAPEREKREKFVFIEKRKKKGRGTGGKLEGEKKLIYATNKRKRDSEEKEEE